MTVEEDAGREVREVDVAAFEAQRRGLTARAQLEARARAALVTNAAFAALASPTQAHVLAQTKALTRQIDALIRLQLNDLSGTE